MYSERDFFVRDSFVLVKVVDKVFFSMSNNLM